MDPTTISTVLSLLGQIAILLLAGGCVVFLEYVRQWAMDWWRQRRLHPIARSVLANRQVNGLLIELRTALEADRANVYLFHNGQTFSNQNPIWRLSCTQECCRSGISHEIGSLQNMLASLFWDIIAPLFGDDKNAGTGITVHQGKAGAKVYFIDVHALTDGFYKRSLIARGVNKAIVCPLMSNKRDVVGFISVNYCSCEAPAPETVVQQMAETAGNIHFALSEV